MQLPTVVHYRFTVNFSCLSCSCVFLITTSKSEIYFILFLKNANLVSWKEEYIWIVVECIACSIPMVSIKIYNKDTLQSMHTLSITSCNSYVPKNTESHRSLGYCMMSWRSYQCKTNWRILVGFWRFDLKPITQEYETSTTYAYAKVWTLRN